jgi:hypothetical protein
MICSDKRQDRRSGCRELVLYQMIGISVSVSVNYRQVWRVANFIGIIAPRCGHDKLNTALHRPIGR